MSYKMPAFGLHCRCLQSISSRLKLKNSKRIIRIFRTTGNSWRTVRTYQTNMRVRYRTFILIGQNTKGFPYYNILAL